MDDVRPPRRPITPGADIAGVPPRKPMPPMRPQTPHVDPSASETPPPAPETPVSQPIRVPIVDHDKPPAFEAPTLDDLKLDVPSDIDAVIEGRPSQPEDPTPPPAAGPVDPEVLASVTEDLSTLEPEVSSEMQNEEPKDESLDLPATTESPVAESTQAPEPTSAGSSLLAEIEAQEKSDSEGRVTAAPTTQPPRKGRGPAILIAVILALALIVGAGYAYLQNNKETPKTVKTPATTPAKTVTKDPATVDDVDAAANEIQAAIDKIDETKQLQESDLTDTNLGIQ